MTADEILVSAPGLLTPAAAQDLLAEHRFRPETRRSYAAALAGWQNWYALRYGAQLPLLEQPRRGVPPGAVIQWILDYGPSNQMPPAIDAELVARGVKSSTGPVRMTTLRQRMGALATWHRLAQLPSPTQDPAVRDVLKASRRAATDHGEIAQSKDALVLQKLQALLDTCDESPVGVRDRAILLMGFGSGGRRPEELARATLEALVRFPRADGGHDFEYRLTRGKTFAATTTGDVRRKPIAGVAGDAIARWLDLLAKAGITDGPLFRRIWACKKATAATVGAQALSPRSISRMVTTRAAAAGIEGAISGRSLRSGFVTTALAQGHDIGEVMKLTDHVRADTIYRHYQRPDEGLNSPLAGLVEE